MKFCLVKTLWRERDDKSCLCISLVLGLDGGGGENWFVLKAGLVAAAAAQGAPPTMGLNGGNGGCATLCKYNVSNKTIIIEEIYSIYCTARSSSR